MTFLSKKRFLLCVEPKRVIGKIFSAVFLFSPQEDMLLIQWIFFTCQLSLVRQRAIGKYWRKPIGSKERWAGKNWCYSRYNQNCVPSSKNVFLSKINCLLFMTKIIIQWKTKDQKFKLVYLSGCYLKYRLFYRMKCVDDIYTYINIFLISVNVIFYWVHVFEMPSLFLFS